LNAIDDAYHDPFSGNFLNSINKLHSVIQKTKTHVALLSFLKNSLLSLNQGDLTSDDFARHKLKDITIPLVDMKNQVMPHLRKEMANNGFAASDCKLFEDNLADVDVALTWMKDFQNPAGRELTRIAKRLGFSNEFHGPMKTGIKAGKDISTVMTYNAIKDCLDPVWQLAIKKPGTDVDTGGQDEKGNEQGNEQEKSEGSDGESAGNADESSDGKTNGKKSLDKGSDCVWYATHAMSMFSKVKPDENESSEIHATWKFLQKLGAEERKVVEREVNQHFREYVSLMAPQESQEELRRQLANTPMAMIQGSTMKNVGIFSDRKLDCESLHRPQWRAGAMQVDKYTTSAKIIIQARAESQGATEGEQVTIGEHDLVFIFDGGKNHQHRQMEQPWRIPINTVEAEDEEGSESKAKRRKSAKPASPVKDDVLAAPLVQCTPITLVKNYDSCKAARTLVRGLACLQEQTESMLLIRMATMSLPERLCQEASGGNKGCAITDITSVQPQGIWQDTFEHKKVIYGTSRVATDKHDADEDSLKAVRKDTDIEPVFFRTVHPSLYRDLIHLYCLFMILDMNAGAGDLAMVCAAKGVLYHGICLSERHAQLIERRTKIWLARELGRPGGHIFNQKVGEAWLTVQHDMYAVRPDVEQQPKQKPKQQPKPKPQPKPSDQQDAKANNNSQAKAKVTKKKDDDVASDWSQLEDENLEDGDEDKTV
jgi:hypothetical protein